MTLRAGVRLQRGELDLSVTLEVREGSVVALLGPNGAGKTSLLLALAGILPLAAGRVELGGEVLEEPASGIRLPPERRRVALVFQDRRLLPHLPALDNVAFGMRAAGIRRGEARRRAGEWLERVGAPSSSPRRPAALSGGEAQRVALARALATEPRLLLLDEPLASVDAGGRDELRRLLAGLLRERDGVTVLVTHDPGEAASLASRLLRMERGRLVQAAPLTGLVLCGGGSRRMGRDKALLRPGGGPPLVASAVARLSALCDPVLVASGRPGRLGLPGLREIPDAREAGGPLAGVVAGLEASPHELVAVVAVDMPSFSPAVLRLLADLVQGRDAAVPLGRGRPEPLHAVYSRRALPHLARALEQGRLAMRDALERLEVRWVTEAEWAEAGTEPAGGFALNLNSPEDLRGWESRPGSPPGRDPPATPPSGG